MVNANNVASSQSGDDVKWPRRSDPGNTWSCFAITRRRGNVSIYAPEKDNLHMNRTVTALGAIFLLLAPQNRTGASGDARTLSFFHTHTGEELTVTYFENGDYRPNGLARLTNYLSDWRNGHRHQMDPALMDILWRIQLSARHVDTWEVISAYRSPETNAMLRKKSRGVATKSQHLEGKAIDVRLRGLDTRKLRQVALDLKLGGVGYYEKSNFVHVDTGRVRSW
jgi:uncharacterized protein YcbK (DUF882 family)